MHIAIKYVLYLYTISYVLFEEISIPPLFLVTVQQVHTHPIITATKTIKNKPASVPSAITLEADCVSEFMVISDPELTAGIELDTATRLVGFVQDV